MMEILPDRCTTIAKKELIYAGTVGLICWLGGIVFINRKKTSDAKNVMCDAAKTMLEDQVDELKLKVFQRMVICVRTFYSLLLLHRFDCGCSQRGRATSKGTCCPSKKVLSTWQCRRKLVLYFYFEALDCF